MVKANRATEGGYPLMLVWLLIPLAGVAAVISTAGGLIRVQSMLDESAPLLEALLGGGAYLTVGLALSALLLAVAWAIGQQHRAEATRRRMLSALNGLVISKSDEASELPVVPAESVTQTSDRDWRMDRLLEELAELNANVLLTDKQLEIKRAHRQGLTADRLVASIERAIAEDRFPTAEELLEQMMARVPDDPRYQEQTSRLVEARAAAEDADIRQATGDAEDMMAVGRFKQAEEIAEALLTKHPDAGGANELLDRIRSQRQTVESEQKQDLYREVETQAEARNWRMAVEAAERLIRLHPKSAEADLVAAQMATLTDNARIEQARRLRDRVRDLLSRKRYAEALSAARELVASFPETQGAIDLRDQIPRLEELAAEENQ